VSRNASNARSRLDGTGQTIAIAGTSDIDVGQSAASETGANGNNDVFTFRTYFGLPTGNAANTPIRISGNTQPLTVCTDTTGTVPYAANPCGIDDLTENSLDVEWSASVAKNAQIILVSSYPASVTDDNLYDSESYIVNHLTAPIMSVSYGECELSNGTAGNVQYYDLWQAAAAEGISVFVASGDSGSASCDDGYQRAASGLTVSGLASTPWNTAVGGTNFNWCDPDTANGSANTECVAAPYWSSSQFASQGSTAAVTSALGYVPEVPWNESCANPITLKWVQDAANIIYGYTSSQISNTEQACNFLLDYDFYGSAIKGYGLLAKYPYITYLLETVGGSGGASNCIVGTAVTDSNTGEISGCTASTGAGTTGQTNHPDTGAPQASLATFNNGWPKPSWQTGVSGIPSDGVRDLPDLSFFASDGYTSSSAYLICVSAAGSNAPCTYSSNTEPFYQEVGGTSVATPAMAGVMALINQKKGVAQGFANPELYKLAASQSYGSCSAESVTAGSATCIFNDIDKETNAMPCDAADATPNCVATTSTLGHSDAADGLGILTGYSAGPGFDLATGLGSLNIANVVNNWVSEIGSGATTITVTPTPNPVSQGTPLSVAVTVASNPSGKTTPTGLVTLSGGGYTSASEPLTSGAYTFTVPAGSLAGGAVTLTVNYTGDVNYAPNSETAGVTVNKLTPLVSATPSPASIDSNQQVIITGTVTGSGATPTGTVTVSYRSTYTSPAASLNSSGQYSVTITPNSLPGGTPNAQNDTLNVQYSGDANYSSASTTTLVAVKFFQVLTPTMTVTPAKSPVNSGSSLLVTVSLTCPSTNPSCTGAAVPTGTVTLYGSGYDTAASPATATLTNGTARFTIPANVLNTNPNPAHPVNNPITATYQGDSNYAPVTQTTTLVVYESVFSLAGTGLSSVTPGTAASATVAVSSASNYTGTVTFTTASCALTGYPTGVTSSTPGNPTCTLSGSGTVTLANGVPTGSPVTFAIHTDSATNVSELRRPVIGNSAPAMQLAKLSTPANPHAPLSRGTHSSDNMLFGGAGGAALAALFLIIIPGGARKWRQMLSVLLLIAAVAIAGCGSRGNTPTTPTVTVTPASSTVAFNTALNVTVAVSGTAGPATGGVTLSGGALAGLNGTLSGGSYLFTIPANTFTGGSSVTLTSRYQGSSAYNSSSGQTTITVNYVPTTAGSYTFTVTPASNPSIATTTTFTVPVS